MTRGRDIALGHLRFTTIIDGADADADADSAAGIFISRYGNLSMGRDN